MRDSFLVATFRDPQALLRAVVRVRSQRLRIEDVYAPYPVHGLDEAMGIRRTKLPFVTLLAGMVGLAFALTFQYYTNVFDWPLNVGGKPDQTTLAFLPICFELTVLIGGLSTVGAFFIRSRLYPGKREQLPAYGVTNNLFALVVHKPDGAGEARQARELLLESGADVEDEEAES